MYFDKVEIKSKGKMAIYHFSVKHISRANGRSSVAAAAYRAGERLIDERTGLVHDFTKKEGVEFDKIYAPENAKEKFLDRQTLWDSVENVERRKDSNLAREFEIAFPHEIDAEQRKQMLDELCQKIVERHNVVVDAVIHAPDTKNGSDERNYHAHIMFTGRQLDKETGDFAKTRNRDFNKEKSSETVTQWRKDFANIVNAQLEKSGSDERVTHLSYKDLKYDKEPTIHEGVTATAMKRRGIDTPVVEYNKQIKDHNQERDLKRYVSKVDDELNALSQERKNIEMQLNAYRAQKPTPDKVLPDKTQDPDKQAREDFEHLKSLVMIRSNALAREAQKTEQGSKARPEDFKAAAAQQIKHERPDFYKSAKRGHELIEQDKQQKPVDRLEAGRAIGEREAAMSADEREKARQEAIERQRQHDRFR